MNTNEAFESVIRILNTIADGNRPKVEDRAAVRVAERRGFIAKNYEAMKLELTAKGRHFVNSGRAHGII